MNVIENRSPVLLALGALLIVCATVLGVVDPAPEAPAGFDNLTNGLTAQQQFDLDRQIFEEREGIADGLGPVYNAQACAECHQNPVTGAISQITEFRAGRKSGGVFQEHPGGSLIQDRAIDPRIQERLIPGNSVQTFRTSLNTLGDGFVEAISDATLIAISQSQPFFMRGQVVSVPVLEAQGTLRVGRFGWKNQHASLVSFSADAYLNEMGITSPLQPVENTSNGNSVAQFDIKPDPEDNGQDVEAFARFIRATKVPPRDEDLAATLDSRTGAQVFHRIGCDTCHVSAIVTAPPGTPINGGAFVVTPALGSQTIHPFSDFLLHDVGTGDGIVQNGPDSTANKLRTPPLWGVRTRTRLMHDGESPTFMEAILRHAGQAFGVKLKFLFLNDVEKRQLIVFLTSL